MLTMPEPAPVALVGELLATQARARGAAALLVDAAGARRRGARELGLPIWARWVRIRGAVKQTPSARSTCRSRSAGRRSAPGDAVVLDADGAAVVAHERVAEVLEGALAREEKERVKRATLAGRRALLRPRRPARDRRGRRDAIPAEIAHIRHAELLTPKPDESLRFFVDVLGMEIEARAGGSVYLRGWGDYQRYSLKLTESATSGLAHLAIRAWSPEALDRRVGRDRGHRARARAGSTAIAGTAPRYRFTRSRRPCVRALYEADRYEPPPSTCGRP